ncbi:hypothetical protein AGDE_13049 [Angomonas deanei]|uniref:HMA domain-containing protein n=1 Tax=Angomonas deanei TaxID=59799 RepID=A0A7G2C735_9TRYP|nr:hypothetical protein AGDE_13049 [Angomonas deanei]CAD2215628.1 hypothetical protein, conserved [Angomonas deanei]|eukprot:EPY22817.1 hypothetical protein AGDE_13049 [Angomonas deanei]
MTCGSCAARIERTIFSLNQENAISILTVNVNHVTMMGVVRHIPGSDKTIVRRLIGLVRQLGYRCSLVRTSFPLTDSERVSLQSSCPNATGEEEEEELEDTEKREAVFEASAHDSVEPTAAEVNPNPDQKRENTYALLIEGMSCASCAARIERTIEKEKTKRK